MRPIPHLPRFFRRFRRPLPTTCDRGASFAQYGAVVLLIAGITAAVFATGLDGRIADLVRSGVCQVSQAATSDGECDERSAPDTRGHVGGGTKVDPADPNDSGRPGQEAFDEAQDEIDEIREYLDQGFWDNFCLFDCTRHPADVMAGMTSEELRALMWSLGDDEIRELLDLDGVHEIVMTKADLETLRHLRGIDRGGIDPTFDDVEGDSANTQDGRRTDLAWGELPNGSLWGDGQISSDDLNQGALGDCWWLAGIGAVADQDPGAIKRMIRENANGTYTVTFGDGSQVTVTPDLVVNSNNSAAFSDPGGEGVLWPAILEKAYAMKEGSYGEIEGGWPKDAMETVTGEDAGEIPMWMVEEDMLSTIMDEGSPVTVTTPGDKKNSHYELESGDELAGNHAYVVKEIKDGKVTLYNPWGHQHATLTMDEFREKLQTVEVGSLD
ncbi:C2 family cysteine protease [Nocardiopsis baichengensis]|uniref:C2 family cysteine protease n=1 Tax=Nocardiopsis baichengensis TaxID=280240 RepID=UPI00034D996B|nr:C2 family cysteine protease [Nocardiopsis baichengensis]